MALTAEERDAILKPLERKGWFWEGDFIYAPHRSMWLLGADLWQGDMSDFLERMSARVERISRHESHYDDPLQHQRIIEDTESLVDTLKELLNARSDI